MNDMTLLYFLTTGLIIVTLLQSSAYLYLMKKQQHLRQKYARLKMDLDAVFLAGQGLKKRLDEQQMRVHVVANRQDKLEINDGAKGGYKQALALLKRGCSSQEVVESCELSQGELDLISQLQKAEKAVRHNKVA